MSCTSPAGAPTWGESGRGELPESRTRARRPSTTRSSSGRSTTEPPSQDDEAEGEEVGGSTRAMRLDEVEWEDVGGPAAQARRRGVSGPNRDELSPLALLRRSAAAYPDRIAVRDGERTLSFSQFADRAWRLGSALRGLGVEPEQRVAMLSLNRLELLEAHFGVPASGGALCAINTRLAPPEVRFIVEHCGAQVLLLDPELEAAGQRAPSSSPACASCGSGPSTRRARRARRRTPPDWPDSEDRPIAVNYTSGTTGAPEGRGLHAPRRLPRRARRARRDAASAPDSALPLDAADVPLQRLVLHLGGAARRRARTCACARPDPAAVWRELRAGASRTSARRRRC